MATRDGGDKDDRGSISRFFGRQNKKRSLREIGQLPNVAGPAKIRATSSPAPELGQSAALAILIDESPEKDADSENAVPLAPLDTRVKTDPDKEITSHLVVTPKSEDNENANISANLDLEESKTSTASKCEEKSGEHSDPVEISKPTQVQHNPFAQFAFQENSLSRSSQLGGEKEQKVAWRGRESSGSASTVPPELRHGQPRAQKSKGKKESSKARGYGSNSGTKAKSGWVRMEDLSSEEQQKVQRKWHSMADPNAPLEVRRFQVLVAARLHARCQDTVVRKVMQSLRDVFKATNDDLDGGLCVAMVAKADPEVLASVMSSLQYYNTKAKQIVDAAQEIQSRFGGTVPESEHSLRQITGIGPVMADLLAFINSRAAYAVEQELVSSS